MIQKIVILGLRPIVSLAALLATAALTAQAPAGQIRVLGQPVESVPDANPVVVSDTIIPPGFALDLQQQGLDLLENPSGTIALFGYLSGGVTRTEPDENTYLILDHNPGVRPPTMTTAVVSSSKVTRIVATLPISPASISMFQTPTIASLCSPHRETTG